MSYVYCSTSNLLISKWNRIANVLTGNSLANDISKSAKLYTQLNYAMANGAIASWVSK
jgi:hypothetical protein